MLSSRKRLGVRERNRWEMTVFSSLSAVVPRAPGAPQHGGDVQQLPGGQAAPHVRPLEGWRPPASPRRSRGCPAESASLPRRRSPPAARATSSRSVRGRSARQRSLPSSVAAQSARRASTWGSSRVAIDFSNSSLIYKTPGSLVTFHFGGSRTAVHVLLSHKSLRLTSPGPRSLYFLPTPAGRAPHTPALSPWRQGGRMLFDPVPALLVQVLHCTHPFAVPTGPSHSGRSTAEGKGQGMPP